MTVSLKQYWRSGEPLIWITGGALGLCLLLLASLLLLIAVNGVTGFWPSSVYTLTLEDGTRILGEIVELDEQGQKIKVKQGNRDVYGSDFRWIPVAEIVEKEAIDSSVLLERTEWGVFFGTFHALKFDGRTVPAHQTGFKTLLQEQRQRTREIRRTIQALEAGKIREVAVRQNAVIRKIRNLATDDVQHTQQLTELQEQRRKLAALFDELETKRAELQEDLDAVLQMKTVDGTVREIPLSDIHRIVQPNQLSLPGQLRVYASRIRDFVSEDPREANTEGGVFPAIFGTVLMVILMSIVVTPLGVLAAIYLHEYARPGPLVTMVRIAVNNLAGVPSIVFGVFGVSFFIYGVGGTIDQWFFSENLPSPTFGTGGILWASLTLALLTVPTVIVATEEGLSALPRHWREASFALGATRFETIWRVIIPALTPAILTGVILATARAAGEVAPLMITGVVKMAPTLPIDGSFPFFHVDRKFMHLGFHIYDLGFQSPNVDAARPMVYATTLLLLLLVIGLNAVAIVVRNRLNKKIHVGAI